MSATSHDDFSGIYSTSVGGGGLGNTANSTSVSLSGVNVNVCEGDRQ